MGVIGKGFRAQRDSQVQMQGADGCSFLLGGKESGFFHSV